MSEACEQKIKRTRISWWVAALLSLGACVPLFIFGWNASLFVRIPCIFIGSAALFVLGVAFASFALKTKSYMIGNNVYTVYCGFFVGVFYKGRRPVGSFALVTGTYFPAVLYFNDQEDGFFKVTVSLFSRTIWLEHNGCTVYQ